MAMILHTDEDLLVAFVLTRWAQVWKAVSHCFRGFYSFVHLCSFSIFFLFFLHFCMSLVCQCIALS